VTDSPASALRTQLEAAPLRTARLSLRLPRVTDARLVYHGYATDADAARWMGWRLHEDIATTDALLADWVGNWKRGTGTLAFMIDASADGRFLGVADLTVGAHGAVLGFVFCRHAWGRGLATEAARRVVDLAFEHFGVWRVWATCAPQNPASRRVLEKVGMRHEGLLRRWIVSPLVSPEPRDSDCLAITRDDWLVRQTGTP
jgi:RimJ/RimL family protein N-acetyltransferase